MAINSIDVLLSQGLYNLAFSPAVDDTYTITQADYDTLTTITINDTADDDLANDEDFNQLYTGPTTTSAGVTDTISELEWTITVSWDDNGETAETVFGLIVVSNAGDGGAIVHLSGDLPPVGALLTVSDWDGSMTSGTGNPSVPYASIPSVDSVPCFASGTLIETPTGPRAIETLAVGDLVMTRDQGPQPIRWAGRVHVGDAALTARPHLRPVHIAAGALGTTRDLLVSPCHRMVLAGPMAEALYGSAEVLVAARDLQNDTTIRQIHPEGGVTYHHLLLDAHAILTANGAPSESLHPDLDALDAATRQEILSLFPALADRPPAAPARPIMSSPGMIAI